MVSEKDNDVIAQAHLAAERLERANERQEELVKRMEAAESRMLLGGLTAAGNSKLQPELTEQQKLEIDLKNFWKGTALEKVFQ